MIRIVSVLSLCLLAHAARAAGPAPGVIYVSKDAVSKLPGNRIEFGAGQSLLVGEINDAAVWTKHQATLKSSALTVNFDKQKVLFVVPWKDNDTLSPVSEQIGTDTASVVFKYEPKTKDIAFAETHGWLRVVPRTVSGLTLTLMPAGTKKEVPLTVTTFDMLEGNKADRLAVQAEVDALLAKIKAGKEVDAAGVDDAQKKWVVFAQAECGWQSSPVKGGTLENVNFGSCMVALTKARLATLQSAGMGLIPGK